jgi:hypothetical protein
MKKIIIYCAVLVLFLSACAKTSKPIVFTKPEKGIFEAPTGNVTSPDSSTTWTQNNITMIRSTEPIESVKGKTKIYQDTLQIDGLKNDAVEAKINKLISDKSQALMKYAEFKNLPVSQGFYATFPKETSNVDNLSIDVYDMYNFNNLIGLEFTVYVAISDKSLADNIQYHAITDAMTIDLNTGNEIHLSDLFVNGFDFEKILNTAILLDASSKTEVADDSLFGSYDYRGGFSGIRSQIGFSLTSDGLDLIFDATYPEFDSGLSQTVIEIPYKTLKDGLALGQRFQSSESLFTDPTVKRTNNYLFVGHDTTLEYMLNGVPVTSKISVYSQITGDWLALTKKWIDEDKQTLESYSKMNAAGIRYEFSAQPIGQYMVISRKIASWTSDYLDLGNAEKAYMVKADGSILTLKDLFMPGYDYETTIKKELAKFLKSEYLPDEKGLPTVDEAYKNLNLTLTYDYFELFNIAFQPPSFMDGQIDVTFKIDDFKGHINEEALLK